MAGDSMLKTERNWVDKQKSLKKKKREDVQIDKLTTTPCQTIQKLLLKNICYQKMYTLAATYLHSVGWWSDDEWTMYLLIYQQTN